MTKKIFQLYIIGVLIFWLISGWTFTSSTSVDSHIACELIIDKLIISECSYGPETGNTSKTIIAVFIDWKDMPAGEQIMVEFQGQVEFVDPFDISCPKFATFIVTPDGSTQDLIVNSTANNCPEIRRSISLPQSCDPPVCIAGVSTGGIVYIDYNGNGLQDASEDGIVDIPIKIYGNSQLLDQTISGTNGAWATNNIPPSTPIRVEFEIPTGLFDGGPGAQSNTRVQIATAGQCDLNLGILATQTFVDEDPWVSTTYFAKGAIMDSSSIAAMGPTIVLNKYFTTEGGPRTGPNGNYYVSNAFETGSVWGLAYQPESHNLFSAAFLKRQAALGPHGLGAIYRTELADFFPSPPPSGDYRFFDRTSLLLNLDDFGIQTGDEGSITRDLPNTPRAFSHDSDVFELIAKWGLGDMDINEGGDSLFVVNLYTQSLIIIEIGNPLNLPITSDRVTEIPIPDPGCSGTGDWRPWGLKYKKGRLYVGGVCSAETTQDPADLWAYVYTWDGRSFQNLIDFNLHYPKGPANGNYCKNFKPWTSDFSKFKIANNIVCGPIPLLSDIDFDADDNMLLGIGDRFGYQAGGNDYGPDPNDKIGYISFTAGDMLRLYKIKGDYLLEKNASSGYQTTAGANNNQGVCGGEYYYEDAFFGHQESILGALAAHPSYNTVLATIMDPATIWSNGWSQFDNYNGGKNVSYSIFAGQIGTFGKAAGLGDIELLVGSSTESGVNVAIGNYVWIDTDLDGIQDPDEAPVIDLPVILYDENGVELASMMTDIEGLYYFRDIAPEKKYHIVLGRSSNYSGFNLNINGNLFTTTTLESRMGYGNRNNDSDAKVLDNTVPIPIRDVIGLTYISGMDNENDFSLDFGLAPCQERGINEVTLNVCEGDSVEFMNVWFSQSHPTDSFLLQGKAELGCDSIIYVDIEIIGKSYSNLDTSICIGEMLQIGNEIFDATRRTGEVLLKGASLLGCDSILIVDLVVLEESEFHLDTSICPGEQIEINGEVFNESRLSGTIVHLGQNQFGCDSIVNVRLQVLEESTFDLSLDICPGEEVMVGSTIFDVNNTSGEVVFSGQNQWGCDSIVHVEIKVLEESIGTLDTLLCPGKKLVIGSETFSENRRRGLLTFKGQNVNGCDSILEVNLEYPINYLDIQPEYEIEYGDSVQLQPFWDSPFNQFEWTPNRNISCDDCPFPWASPLETTDYTLSGIDHNGCPYLTRTRVIVFKEKGIYIPNVFSPNGDGLNDFFTVYANPFLEIVEELLIYDRWGDFIIRLTDIDHSIEPQGWNGYFNGEPMDPAVFVYVAKVRWKDGERETYSGDVTLVR